MKAYLDSSVLVKLYYPEPESEALQEWILRNRPEILLSPIHCLEMTNAMALKLFRGEIRAEAFAQWRLWFQRDQAERVLSCYAPPWQYVMSDAERLAIDVSARLGTRSLDILHIALARLSAANVFMTNNVRQCQAARECELDVVLLSSLEQ